MRFLGPINEAKDLITKDYADALTGGGGTEIDALPVATEATGGDKLVGLDVSDTTESAAGTTKTFPIAVIQGTAWAVMSGRMGVI